MPVTAGFALGLLLCACGGGAPEQPSAPDLETAAIARGLVRDPARFDPVGLYARDTDRLCMVADGNAYRIGALVDYGEGIGCSGRGTATRSGNALRIDLGEDCRFEARFDGDAIAFPAELPGGCASRCSGRASLAALTVARLSGSTAEAGAMRDGKGRMPCAPA